MTQEQVKEIIRDALKVIGMVAVGFGVAQGDVDTWTAIVLDIAGPLLVIAGIVWGQSAKTPSAIEAQAAELRAAGRIGRS